MQLKIFNQSYYIKFRIRFSFSLINFCSMFGVLLFYDSVFNLNMIRASLSKGKKKKNNNKIKKAVACVT